jgi:hypothetical protein
MSEQLDSEVLLDFHTRVNFHVAWNRLGLFEVLRLDGLRLPKFKANG